MVTEQIAPLPEKKMDWTKRPPTHSRYQPPRASLESRRFSNATLAILWGSGVACLLIPFTMYMTPIFWGAGVYYGWKIRRQKRLS